MSTKYFRNPSDDRTYDRKMQGLGLHETPKVAGVAQHSNDVVDTGLICCSAGRLIPTPRETDQKAQPIKFSRPVYQFPADARCDC